MKNYKFAINYIKRALLTATIGLSILLGASASMANASADDPSMQGIELNLRYAVDTITVYPVHTTFPIKVTFEPYDFTCIIDSRRPQKQEITLTESRVVKYSESSHVIEKRNSHFCGAQNGQFKVKITVERPNMLTLVRITNFTIRQALFGQLSGTFNGEVEIRDDTRVHFANVTYESNPGRWYNNRPFDIKDKDNVYITLMLTPF